MKDAVVVMVTMPNGEIAADLTGILVREGLAACGNVVPGVRSIYMWNGALHDESEVMVMFKTAASKSRELCDRIVELHPYEVPEVLVLPVVDGNEAYLAWVQASVA